MSHDFAHNPGSDEALDLGCICPVLDNGHGRLKPYLGWVIVVGCPLHSPQTPQEDKHDER